MCVCVCLCVCLCMSVGAHAVLPKDGRAVFEKWHRVTKLRATPLEICTSTKVPESPVDFSCPLCSSINEFLHLCIFLVVPFLRGASGRLGAVRTTQMLEILPKRIRWIAQSTYNTSTLFPRCCISLALSSFTCLRGSMRWNQA